MMNADLILSLAQFIGAIALLIVFHELGHFLIARLLGVEIEEFGIGFPPRLVTLFKAGGTLFTLNWLPFGGFVRPKGENNPEVEGGLAAASPWVRMAVLLAGPMFNALAAIVLYAVIFSRVGMPILGPVEILEVVPNSPAALAGLQPGDQIVQVNDTQVEDTGTLQDVVYSHLGEQIALTLERGGQRFTTHLVPRPDPPDNEGAMGIVMRSVSQTRPVSASEAAVLGTGAVIAQSRMILTLPARIIDGSIQAEDARLVGYKGMFDIYQDLRETEVETGTPPGVGAMFFAASISISLALLNLLPVPALDGGRILFTLPEIVLRRRIPPAYENIINVVGLAMLFLLMIYINIQDFINPLQIR